MRSYNRINRIILKDILCSTRKFIFRFFLKGAVCTVCGHSMVATLYLFDISKEYCTFANGRQNERLILSHSSSYFLKNESHFTCNLQIKGSLTSRFIYEMAGLYVTLLSTKILMCTVFPHHDDRLWLDFELCKCQNIVM